MEHSEEQESFAQFNLSQTAKFLMSSRNDEVKKVPHRGGWVKAFFFFFPFHLARQQASRSW